LQSQFPEKLEYFQPEFIGIVIVSRGLVFKRNTHVVENHTHIGSTLNVIVILESVFLHPEFDLIGQGQALIAYF
jgi:hypothetical protein